MRTASAAPPIPSVGKPAVGSCAWISCPTSRRTVSSWAAAELAASIVIIPAANRVPTSARVRGPSSVIVASDNMRGGRQLGGDSVRASYFSVSFRHQRLSHEKHPLGVKEGLHASALQDFCCAWHVAGLRSCNSAYPHLSVRVGFRRTRKIR